MTGPRNAPSSSPRVRSGGRRGASTLRNGAHPAPKAAAAAPASPADLARLLTWLSPAFPVGAFSYSSGLEWVIEAGDIRDAVTLGAWIAALLERGSGLSDAILLAHAYAAASRDDPVALYAIAELAAALASSRERHLETTAQGQAFFDAVQVAWPCAALTRLRTCWDGPMAYPVAVGVAGAGHGVALPALLQAFVHALAANWISAGVRLVPLGQSDSLRILASLEPQIAATSARAATATLDDLGTATFRADIASMRHEAQYTRLFRT